MRRLLVLSLSVSLLAATDTQASVVAGADGPGDSCVPLAASTALPLSDLMDSGDVRVTAAAAAAGVVEPNVEEAYQDALAGLPDGITARELSRRDRRAAGPITIPVVFHVIQANASSGALSDQEIADQMDVLNDAFDGTIGGADTGIRFELVDTDRTINPDWSPTFYRTPESEEMRNELHQGGSRTLNLYTTELLFGLLGWATYPTDYETDPGYEGPDLDGVVVDYRTLPGGSNPTYNLGYTAVHETGHWAGLFHTFQGKPDGCTEPGDLVADTPPEFDPASGCPVGRDTCPAPGQDPIHNYMDYSYDSCLFEFTPGQGDRMNEEVSTYRTTFKLSTKAKDKQKLGDLRITGGCDDVGCKVTAKGKIVADGPGRKSGSFKLKKDSGGSSYGDPADLTPNVSKSDRKKLRKRLKDGWKAKAKVKVSAKADTGQTAKTKLTIGVKR